MRGCGVDWNCIVVGVVCHILSRLRLLTRFLILGHGNDVC